MSVDYNTYYNPIHQGTFKSEAEIAEEVARLLTNAKQPILCQ